MCKFLNCLQDLRFYAREIVCIVRGRWLAALGGRWAGIGAGMCFGFLMERRAGVETSYGAACAWRSSG